MTAHEIAGIQALHPITVFKMVMAAACQASAWALPSDLIACGRGLAGCQSHMWGLRACAWAAETSVSVSPLVSQRVKLLKTKAWRRGGPPTWCLSPFLDVTPSSMFIRVCLYLLSRAVLLSIMRSDPQMMDVLMEPRSNLSFSFSNLRERKMARKTQEETRRGVLKRHSPP